jgi:hypothetical protein
MPLPLLQIADRRRGKIDNRPILDDTVLAVREMGLAEN